MLLLDVGNVLPRSSLYNIVENKTNKPHKYQVGYDFHRLIFLQSGPRRKGEKNIDSQYFIFLGEYY
jgi:hypothetical protein